MLSGGAFDACNSGSKVFVVGRFDGFSSRYVSLNNGVSWENADIPHELYSIAMFGGYILGMWTTGHIPFTGWGSQLVF